MQNYSTYVFIASLIYLNQPHNLLSTTVDYKAGIGLDIGFKEDGKPKAKVCKWCGSITHKTKRSKQCPFNAENIMRENQQSGEVKDI